LACYLRPPAAKTLEEPWREASNNFATKSGNGSPPSVLAHPPTQVNLIAKRPIFASRAGEQPWLNINRNAPNCPASAFRRKARNIAGSRGFRPRNRVREERTRQRSLGRTMSSCLSGKRTSASFRSTFYGSSHLGRLCPVLYRRGTEKLVYLPS
jgi:hypothetical protein